MELKDVILSTLAEMEDGSNVNEQAAAVTTSSNVETVSMPAMQESALSDASEETPEDELLFMQNVRERLLVLFEGFQSPNNTQIEAKIDLTLNFLEYLLATIESRIDTLSKKERR